MSKNHSHPTGPGVPTLVLAVIALAAVVTPAVIAQEEESIWTEGPGTAALGDVATVALNEGYLFADAETTRQMMEALGNPINGTEVGLITSDSEEETWFIVFEYDEVGYVTDEDQDEIDAGALLESIREATEAANEQRRAMGASALHVTTWSDPPHYDAASHNLVWALEAVDEGTHERVVNYNVRVLGREGFMSVTLVTDPTELMAHKPEVEKVLASFAYNEGQRYADYRSGDKLAGYGLAALVAGGAGAAAAKLGLFAVLGKFLGKIWKLLVIGAVAVGGALKRLFGGREQAGEGAP